MSDAAEKLNAAILQIGADAARIVQNSAEFAILQGRVPSKLPDPEPPKGEQNPLRRQDGKPITRR